MQLNSVKDTLLKNLISERTMKFDNEKNDTEKPQEESTRQSVDMIESTEQNPDRVTISINQKSSKPAIDG